MNKWKTALKNLGFNESEAEIYLIALSLGPSTTQNIASQAGVSRVTAYTAIETLTRHGLMSTVQHGKRALYQAESPERLVSFVGTRIQQMEATLNELKDSVDELKLIQRGEKPIVRLLEDTEGLHALQDDIVITAPKDTVEFFNIDTIHKIFTEEALAPFRKKLAKLHITGRSMYCGKEKTAPRAGVNRKHIPGVQFDGDIFVYGDKIALSVFRGKLMSVIIESKELAKTVRVLFDLAWKK